MGVLEEAVVAVFVGSTEIAQQVLAARVLPTLSSRWRSTRFRSDARSSTAGGLRNAFVVAEIAQRSVSCAA